ncbi:MAG TPA: M56 family metallopeptidase [Candidatus Sulfotelmatobacter sp.]|nr:M56 family metallopeptidase [Candidatus Sulfotelmatobacter sp.]
MNPLIENLNGWGENFLHFAWPMLWQSSLLIAVVFALDYVFARKIRASIRYALWLIVLVKLVLPPTLALPTGAAWWLTPTKPPIKAPVPQKYTITYDNPMPQMEIPSTPVTVPEVPKPKLNGPGWLVVTSVTFTFALLSLLIYRWRQVIQKIRAANDAEAFSNDLEGTKQLAGLRSHVRLKIVDAEMSPAVCGLFRPVILLPRALAERLSAEQMHAVLLHEIFHLRRRDVWVNCAQALLQIFYWWHPLLWVANVRIRRVREEAVDDAVMLALRDEAETYAPTLLEVAKLALRRPLMSLGLVGIMESRSALRQRIERLMDFRAPRKAGLTVFSVVGIFAFSAVALPMGESPEKVQTNEIVKVEDEGAIVTSIANPKPESNRLFDPDNTYVNTVYSAQQATLQKTNPPQILVQTWIFQAPSTFNPKDSVGTNVTDSDSSFSKLQRIRGNLKAKGWQMNSAPRVVTFSGERAEMYIGKEKNSISFFCVPTATNGLIKLELIGQEIYESTAGLATNEFHCYKTAIGNMCVDQITVVHPRDSGLSNMVVLVSGEIVTNTAHFQQRLNTIIKPADSKAALPKLQTIRLDNFSSDGLKLGEVLQQLAVQSKAHDPEHKGVNFLIDDNADNAGLLGTAIDPATGLPLSTTPKTEMGSSPADVPVTITAMQNATLGDVLDAVVKGASRPVHYTIHDYSIQFLAGTNPPVLFTRIFKVNTNATVNDPLKDPALSIEATLRKAITNGGVNLDSPPGKSVFYNKVTGLLFVRATKEDLDKLYRILPKFLIPPPQVHIKARFILIPRNNSPGTNSYDSYLGRFKLEGTNRATLTFNGFGDRNTILQPATVPIMTGILPDKKFWILLHALESRPGVENLGEPEVTTTSGRQTQMRCTEVLTVITNMLFQQNPTNPGDSATTPQTAQVETGPILDVVPYVLADGYTIDLAVIPSDTEFLGYEQVPQKSLVPTFKPKFQAWQMVTVINVYDGQTIVLGGIDITNSIKDIVPVLGAIPVLGHLFRSEHTQISQVLVCITANIVDPAGNRVHQDNELPFAQQSTPPQPKPQSTFPGQPPR